MVNVIAEKITDLSFFPLLSSLVTVVHLLKSPLGHSLRALLRNAEKRGGGDSKLPATLKPIVLTMGPKAAMSLVLSPQSILAA